MTGPDDVRVLKAEAVFQALVGLPPAERPAALESKCGSDHELRDFVQSLLRCDESWPDALDGRVRFHPVRSAGPSPPFQIGRFRALRALGEGGMGVVYEAEQEHPHRRVALKILRFTFPSHRLMQRFALEAEVLGQLNHPGIAQVYEAGSGEVATLDGQRIRLAFVAMELVRGEQLLDFAQRRRLSRRQRLDLATRICDAVHHAHQKAVIHRDLKPANILVDQAGQPKVLDFGVARVLPPDSAESTFRTGLTEEGQVLGTLAYMSPEQARGSTHEVDVRSDVYSLGVILFELLSGHLPYELTGKPLPEIVRQVTATEPARLSALDRSLRGDVETIVHKAITADRSRRYQSASELGGDIRRYLAGAPIDAKRDSGLYVLRKNLRRYRWPVAAAAILVLGLAAFSVYAFVQAGRFERQAEQARKASAKAERFAQLLEDTLRGVGPSVALGRDTTLLNEMLNATRQQILDGELRAVPEDEVRLRLTLADVYLQIEELERASEMLMPAIEMTEKRWPESAEHARAIWLGAQWLRVSGRYSEARTRHKDALAIRQRLHSGDHAELAQSLHSAGRLHEALEMYKRLYRGDHKEIAATLDSLAWSERHTPAKALPYAEQALEMRQRLYAGNHPDVAQSLRNVGWHLNELGRPDAAVQRMQESLDMRRSIFPDPSWALTDSLYGLCECYESLARHEDALAAAQEALRVAKSLYADNHAEISHALNYVAQALHDLGRSSEALPLFQRSLGIRRQSFAANHFVIAQSLRGVGSCLVSLGRPDMAVACFEECVEISEAMGNVAYVAGYQSGLATALSGMGRYEEAEALLAQAWETILSHDVLTAIVRECISAHVTLYETWHTESDDGHGSKAAAWCEMLGHLENNPHLQREALRALAPAAQKP